MHADTHVLWGEIIDAGGPKRIANAIHRDVSTVYRYARNPMDASDPDGTGAPGPLDLLEAVVQVLAARPGARVALRKLHLWTDSLCRGALDRGERRPETNEQLMARATTALRELADVIDECRKEDPDEARLIHECCEVTEVLAQIIGAAEAGMRVQVLDVRNLRSIS